MFLIDVLRLTKTLGNGWLSCISTCKLCQIECGFISVEEGNANLLCPVFDDCSNCIGR